MIATQYVRFVCQWLAHKFRNTGFVKLTSAAESISIEPISRKNAHVIKSVIIETRHISWRNEIVEQGPIKDAENKGSSGEHSLEEM